jgi:TRAP-type C4-dicarboxylate transport system permease small subunit
VIRLTLSKPSRFIARIFEAVIGVLLMLIFGLTVVNVFCRYVLNYSFGWADELSRFMFIWIGFLGATAVYAYDGHAALTMFIRKIPQPAQRIIRVLLTLLATGIFSIFLWRGLFMVRTTVNLSPALYLPMKFIYLCVPLGACVGVVYGLEKAVAIARGHDEGVR